MTTPSQRGGANVRRGDRVPTSAAVAKIRDSRRNAGPGALPPVEPVRRPESEPIRIIRHCHADDRWWPR